MCYLCFRQHDSLIKSLPNTDTFFCLVNNYFLCIYTGETLIVQQYFTSCLWGEHSCHIALTKHNPYVFICTWTSRRVTHAVWKLERNKADNKKWNNLFVEHKLLFPNIYTWYLWTSVHHRQNDVSPQVNWWETLPRFCWKCTDGGKSCFKGLQITSMFPES